MLISVPLQLIHEFTVCVCVCARAIPAGQEVGTLSGVTPSVIGSSFAFTYTAPAVVPATPNVIIFDRAAYFLINFLTGTGPPLSQSLSISVWCDISLT